MGTKRPTHPPEPPMQGQADRPTSPPPPPMQLKPRAARAFDLQSLERRVTALENAANVPRQAPIARHVESVMSDEEMVNAAQNADSEAKWAIGKAAHDWLMKYARGRTDAEFGAFFGMTGDQVQIRRRVHYLFSPIRGQFPDLRFGHFYAALEWDDADECLSWANEMGATVAEMRAWRRAQRGEDLSVDE